MSQEQIQKLVGLVGQLSEDMVGEIIDFVEFLGQKARVSQIAKVKALLDAVPEDDEPVSDETLVRLAAAQESVRLHGTISMEEVKRKYGL
jgi:hypothetical protein